VNAASKGRTVERVRTRMAEVAADLIGPSDRVGLGSGRAAEAFVHALAERRASTVAPGGVVATSRATRDLARGVGLAPCPATEAIGRLDVAVDGAAAIDPRGLLWKHEAMRRERFVMALSARVLILAEWTKLLQPDTTVLPPVAVQIMPFGWRDTQGRIAACGLGEARVWLEEGRPKRTDDGDVLLWVRPTQTPWLPAFWRARMLAVPGVTEVGLFVDQAYWLIIGEQTGDVSFYRREIGGPLEAVTRDVFMADWRVSTTHPPSAQEPQSSR